MSRGSNRSFVAGGTLRARPVWPTVRQTDLDFVAGRVDDSDAPHRLQSVFYSLTYTLDHADSSVWNADVPSGTRDVVPEAFDIVTGVSIPAGDYRFVRYRVHYATNPSQPLNGSATVKWGGFYGGSLVEASANATVRFSPHWALTLADSFNDGRLPSGSFQTNLFSARLEVNLSRELYSSAYAQVNSETRLGTLAWRVRWRYRPASDAFLVLNAESQSLAGPNARSVSPAVGALAKITYAFSR